MAKIEQAKIEEMLSLVVVLSLAGPTFAKPVPWALNFAAPGDFCMVGDVDGDGYADLIRVSPKGDAFIDVAINAQGMKCMAPQRANSNWGKDCQAACVGDFDDVPGADIVGLFNGDTLRLAHGFKDGTFKDEPEWMKLPKKLRKPQMAYEGSRRIDIWDQATGQGYVIDARGRTLQPANFPRGAVTEALRTWSDPGGVSAGDEAVVATERGDVLVGDLAKGPTVIRGVKAKPHIVASKGVWLVDEANGSDSRFQALPKFPFPDAPCIWAAGDVENNGERDLIQFRFGDEPHTGHDVLLYRQIPPAASGSKASGYDAPVAPNADSSGDGLLDAWKLNGFRGLDLKSLGCVPGQKDLVCLISRFSNTNKDLVDTAFKRIEAYYLSLGWHLHPVFLDVLTEEDQKKSWQQLRDKFLPAKWRGVAHWMAVTPYGGGQADELSDGGVCGGGNEWALYATFIHEFGHQLGLNHEGFYGATGCPLYPSLMNYPYSYTFEGDIKKIHYSDGTFKDFVLRETDLDETLPFPYEKVKFLGDAPYHFHLKPNGKTTLIDWNWNGVFGEKHVRADINYSYSTSAGRRDNVDKTNAAPWTFTHGKSAYLLYAQEGVKADGKGDPSVGPEKPGWLFLRRLIKPFQWDKPAKIVNDGVTGDPVAISYNGEIVVSYPGSKGLAVRWLKTDGDKIVESAMTLVDDTDSRPSLGVYKGRLFLFEWSPKDGLIRYRTLTNGHKFGDLAMLAASGAEGSVVKSKVPISMAVDTVHDQVLIGTAEDQDANRPNRWAIRHEKVRGAYLEPSPLTANVAAGPALSEVERVALRSPNDLTTLRPNDPRPDREWIEGEKGNAKGSSRCILLFDEKGATGMKGRLLYYMLGSTSEKTPWQCVYVAQSVADKTVNGGWMVKRYYDEWTQSRSAPAACWFEGDILYAYRWVDGSQGDGDNILHVGYNGTGIESAPMGDFDDIGFIRDFGIQNSILYLRQ